MWAAENIMSTSGAELGLWAGFWSVNGIALIIILFIFALALMSRSGSKIYANTAFGIKFIPLFLVIIAGIVFVAMGEGTPITNDTIDGLAGTDRSTFMNIMIVMPAILFTFDGFLFSSALSNDAKDAKTYKRGLM
jgi:amino acid transporter